MLLGGADVLVRTERAARILVGGSFSLKLLSLLPHAVRTGTSAFPALTDLVQLFNEFLGKAASLIRPPEWRVRRIFLRLFVSHLYDSLACLSRSSLPPRSCLHHPRMTV